MDDELDIIGGAVSFGRRPANLPANLRPGWRVVFLVLSLAIASRGRRSSVRRLHVINWAIKTPQNRTAFNSTLQDASGNVQATVLYDPALDKAISLSVYEGLVSRSTAGTVKLTESGVRLADTLATTSTTFADEIAFLKSIRSKLTEPIVDRILYARIEA